VGGQDVVAGSDHHHRDLRSALEGFEPRHQAVGHDHIEDSLIRAFFVFGALEPMGSAGQPFEPFASVSIL
jgi:hypothetical protein